MTKKKIAWITDSTAFIPEDLKKHPDVYSVPLTITFSDNSYEDGVDLSTEELYRRINQEKEVPKTSQPSAGKFAELLENLKDSYEQAIAIHVSSKLSGTMASCLAAKEMTDFDMEVVDSKSMSYAITTLIYKGMELAKEGIFVKEIANKLRDETQRSENYILLGSLDQFYKGGRMSGTQYLLGNILQIKPIIRINQEGEFQLFEKVRSSKKALQRILSLLQEAKAKAIVKEVQIMHGNVLERAQELESMVKNLFPDVKTVIGEISSAIAVHAGEGTVAIIWHNE